MILAGRPYVNTVAIDGNSRAGRAARRSGCAPGVLLSLLSLVTKLQLAQAKTVVYLRSYISTKV
jgi:hypothetical protein